MEVTTKKRKNGHKAMKIPYESLAPYSDEIT
jgi:hypothetical protein